MMKIYYKNHLGEVVNLKKKPYHILTGDILDYKWDVVSDGNKITGFNKGIHEKNVKFEIFTTKEEYHQALDYVTEIFEKDILAGIPGQLYINEQYLKCYITESTKTEWESDILAVTELTIMTDYPYWIMEKEMHFEPTEITSEGNKKYPLRYPYRYSNGLSDMKLLNNHYTDSDFRMIIFGKTANPAVFVGGHLYQVNITLEEEEYLTIDSSKSTVTVTKRDGTPVNAFNYRLKEQDIFKKLPQGLSYVKWSGSFGFDIILLQERSQPKCA